MIWVAQKYRDHPDEFITTMRSFGVSLHDLGGTLSWAELLALTTMAANDTTTYLGAAIQGYAYRASVPDLVTVAANTGKRSEEVLPWGMAERMRAQAARHVTAHDIEVAQQQLARVSAFRKLDGFPQQ